MNRYRLSTKYRGPRSDLADYVSMSSITHYNKHLQDNGQSLNQNLNKVYIRNFYEYHHRKRPGEGKTAKQEYDKELKEESKKQRLKEIESQVSFDRTSSSSFDSTEDDVDVQNAHLTNGNVNENLTNKTNSLPNVVNDKPQNGHMVNGNSGQLTNGFRTKRKSTKNTKINSNRAKGERNSKDFFDALLSNKKLNFETEYKKCVKQCKELSLAKQIQAYQLETLTDNYDELEDTYNELNHKFKFINRECKMIEKDIERLKSDYCRLVKQDLIKKNNVIKENEYIPIYNEIPSIELVILGNLNNYERAYDKFNCYVNYDEYKRLTKLNNSNLFLNNTAGSSMALNDDLVDENNNKITINGVKENEDIEHNKMSNNGQGTKNEEQNDKDMNKQQVDDVLYLIIKRPDCTFFCDKVSQLVQDNLRLKAKIKRLHFEISNEKRKNGVRRNGVVEFEFSDNLEKQKNLSRKTRHTINVVNSLNPIKSPFNSSNLLSSSNKNLMARNLSRSSTKKFGSQLCSLNVFEIPTQKVEIFQMRLKMQSEEFELQIARLKKMKELIDNQSELQKKSLKESQTNETIYQQEQRQLFDKVKQLKLKGQQLSKENEILIKKVHQLTESATSG